MIQNGEGVSMGQKYFHQKLLSGFDWVLNVALEFLIANKKSSLTQFQESIK